MRQAEKEAIKKKLQARVLIQKQLRVEREERNKFLMLELPQLYPAQLEIKNQGKRFNVLDIGRRAGKTYLGIHLALEGVALGRRVGWFAPRYKYILDVWRDFELATKPFRKSIDTQQRRIELTNGGVLECWSMEDPDAGRSRSYHMALVDEAAMMPTLETSWTRSIRPTLSQWKGGAWFLSTPKGLNYFYELYNHAGEPGYEDWQSWQFPSAINPYLDNEEIEVARKEMPDLAFRQEYLAEFISTDGAVFRGVDAVLTAPTATPADHARHHVVGGVDWGKSHDFTAVSIFCVDCKQELCLDRFNEVGWDFQRGRVQALAEKWRVSELLIENNSIGDPNIAELRKVLPDNILTISKNMNSKTKPRWVQDLAVAIEHRRGQWLPHRQGRFELVSYAAETLASGYTRYEAPDGGYDDTVVARMLAWQGAKAYIRHVPEDELIESRLPERLRHINQPPKVGSWEYDSWAMVRALEKKKIEDARKRQNKVFDNPWEPTSQLDMFPEWGAD